MNFKDKLNQLFKLQLSINALTEEVFKKQLVTLSDYQNPHKAKKKLINPWESSSKYSELLKIVQLLQKQNNELASAIRKNILQINANLGSLTEKTLNILVVAQQHIPQIHSSEFQSEKSSIELDFKELSNYMTQFYLLFHDAKGSYSDFERFSTISNRDISPHLLETEDVEFNNYIRIQDSSYSDESSQTDQFLKILESEIESDKNSLNTLAGIMKKVEYEKDLLMKRKNFDRILLFGKIIEEFLAVVRTCLTTKKTRMDDLRSVKDSLNRSDKVRRKQDCSFEDISKNQQLSKTISQQPVMASMNNSAKSDFLQMEIFKPFEFKVDQYDFTVSESSKTSNGKLSVCQNENPKDKQKEANEIKSLQSQIETLKKAESKYKADIENLQTLNNHLKKHIKSKNLAIIESFSHLKIELKSFKEFCFSEFSQSTKKTSQFFSTLLKHTEKSLMFTKKVHSEEIESMVESNECYQIQIEALKEAFQGEVKKMNVELSESKKINEELKDCLIKANAASEQHKKFLIQLGQSVNVVYRGDIDQLKAAVFEYCSFVNEVKKEFREENLAELVKSLKESIER